MQKRLQEISQSTIARIVLVVVAFVLPLNIMTLVLSFSLANNNREQVYNEIQNRLDNSVDTFEAQLRLAMRRMTKLNHDDVNFRIMENPPANMTDKELGSTLYDVRNSLKAARQEYDVTDQMYFYFREPELMILDGYSYSPIRDVREQIFEFCAQETTRGTEWGVGGTDGRKLLFSHTRWNNADFGVIVDLEWALKRMGMDEPGDGRCVFFMDLSEAVYSGTGEKYLQSKNMTLQELRASRKYEVIAAPLEDYGLVLVEVLENDKVLNQIPTTVVVFEVFAVFLTVVSLPVMLLYIRNWVSRPLHRLTAAIDEIESGNMDFRIEEHVKGREFEQINRNFNSMMEEVRKLKIEAYEREIEKKDIRMRYLSQQVQPHFILNTMNILYSYEPEEYPLIQRMILCLSKYFRYIVRVNSDFVELSQEMNHVKNYFEIQQARFPEQFFSVVEYDEKLGRALIPPLLIQNFAENAIKYSLKGGNKITIFVVADILEEEGHPARMRVRLADTGEGISDELLEKIERFKQTGEPQEGLGVGITNSIERLKYLYEDRTDIRFWRDESYGGTTVEIVFPIYYE